MVTTARSKITRRQLLRGSAGAFLLAAAAGDGAYRLLAGSTAPAQAQRFHSRPDLEPPPVGVLVDAGGTAPGLVMLTAARTADYQHGPMIVDNAGQVVWFAPQTQAITNLQVQSYEGRSVLAWWEGQLIVPAGYGRGEYVIVGPDYQELTRVKAGNGLVGDLHEFMITPQGTALFTAYEPVARDLSSVGGSSRGRLLDCFAQEVDIRTGRVLFQWSAAEHVALDESYVKAPTAASELYDFFHMNSIDVDGDGHLLISSRHMSTVYKVDRSSGDVIWRLGGKRSDFKLGRGAKFAFQHHVRHHPGGVMTVFDNGAGPYVVQKSSRGLKLAVDDRAMRVSLLQAYHPHPSVLATSQGSVQLLSNGNAFVGWGMEPYFSEYGPGAALRFDARIGSTSNSYRAFRSEWVGRPSEPPAIAVELSGSEGVTVYASWNGATEVARWDVLAGNSAHNLRTVGSFARDGFETALPLHASAQFFAVEGRDRAGRVLGRSKVVAGG